MQYIRSTANPIFYIRHKANYKMFGMDVEFYTKYTYKYEIELKSKKN